MLLEENKAIHRRLIEEVESKKNVDMIYEIFQSDYIVHEAILVKMVQNGYTRLLWRCLGKALPKV